jgi:UDP-GlcNAc:undecaprenyl-phosphate/decaprenyl-phosphate GlcNAc-1-phosphate transferase
LEAKLDFWILSLLLLAGVAPCFCLSWLAVGWLRSQAENLGLMDRPGNRKIHSVAVPLGGGLGIWFSMVATLGVGCVAVFGLNQSETLAGLLPASIAQHLNGFASKISEIGLIVACGTVLVALGLADDRMGLPWWFRLAVEFGVASVCVYWQGLRLTAFVDLPWLTGFLSVLWIVILINSFNMLDNMDGLSSGVAGITSFVVAWMLLASPGSSASPQIFVALMMLMLVGALLGFLWHNWPPAKIFMGDAGSYWIGFWIAVGTLLGTYTEYRDGRYHAVIAPLVILAIPLYDTFSVILIRLKEGRSPFDGDQRHFSHRLVDLGMTKKQAVLTIYLATAACSLGALLLPSANLAGAGVIVIQTLLIVGLIAVLEAVGRRERQQNPRLKP